MTVPSDPSVPRKAGLSHTFIQGGTEVIGPGEAAELFAQAGRRTGIKDAEKALLSSLHTELKERYGERGGQGVALRLGRASFKYGFREWGEARGMNAPAFRLQPSARRVLATLQVLAEQVQEHYGAKVRVSQDTAHWYWRVENCPACHGRSAPEPDCHLISGLLQETLAWAGGGRFFQVSEIECSAMGAPACTFRIVKKPID